MQRGDHETGINEWLGKSEGATARLLGMSAGMAVGFLQAGAEIALAQAQSTAILTGRVSSAEEGPMEGVVVSARKDGATFTVSGLRAWREDIASLRPNWSPATTNSRSLPPAMNSILRIPPT